MLQNKIINKKLQNIRLNPQQEVSQTTIDQLNLLQTTLGNQQVQELIKSGIITPDKELKNQASLENAQLQEQQTAQILADREALDDRIAMQISKKQSVLTELAATHPGREIYANVVTELHYVSIPGAGSLNFYHYTELKDVALSYNNINTISQPKAKIRGNILEVTDSFACPVEVEPATREAEIPEPETTPADAEPQPAETTLVEEK